MPWKATDDIRIYLDGSTVNTDIRYGISPPEIPCSRHKRCTFLPLKG